MESGLRYRRLEEPKSDKSVQEDVAKSPKSMSEMALEDLDLEATSVVGETKRERKLRRIDVQNKVYGELNQLMTCMREEYSKNNAYLKALCESIGTKPAAELIRRDDRVEVEIHVAFLRIVDIITRFGVFHAELFIQAKWKETRLKGLSQVEIDHLDFDQLWHPDIVLINAYGEPDDVKKWFCGSASAVAGEAPTLYARMRLRGQFKETLELQDFPVDIQGLTVIVSCEKPVNELFLIPDKEILPTVTLETFNDINEFALYEHVQVIPLDADPYSIDKYSRSSRIAYTCSVARRPNYYLVNSLFIQCLLCGIVLLVYVTNASEFSTRTAFTATLLLTSVAFRFTTANDIPNIPYLTRLDEYGIFCKVFLVFQCVENGIVYYIDRTAPEGSNAAHLTDRYCAIALGIVFLVFNVVYAVIIGRKYYDNTTLLAKKEQVYRQEKAKREGNKYTTTTTAFGPKYGSDSEV